MAKDKDLKLMSLKEIYLKNVKFYLLVLHCSEIMHF